MFLRLTVQTGLSRQQSCLLMVLHSFVPFPAEFVAMANGMLYGPIWGTVITWSGAMLGAFADRRCSSARR